MSIFGASWLCSLCGQDLCSLCLEDINVILFRILSTSIIRSSAGFFLEQSQNPPLSFRVTPHRPQQGYLHPLLTLQ
jgi:hypothetical protein